MPEISTVCNVLVSYLVKTFRLMFMIVVSMFMVRAYNDENRESDQTDTKVCKCYQIFLS